jgi:glycosyltransferase involved in cell wall biosynthesis
MKVLVCSNLYPIEKERTAESDTQAIKVISENVSKFSDVTLRIVKFYNPSLKRLNIFPSTSSNNELVVYNIPLFVKPARNFFFSYITGVMLCYIIKKNFCPDLAVCHSVRNFRCFKTHAGKLVGKCVFVVHRSDLYNLNIEDCIYSSDLVLPRSYAIKKRIEERFKINCKGVLYSGIDSREIKQGIENNVLGSGIKITIASMFIKQKKIIETLLALSNIRKIVELHVDIFGDGPLRNEIELVIKKLDLESNVVLHGFRPRVEVMKYMRQSNMLIMPSERETFGLVYLEAMSQGCVAVGLKDEGIDGIIEDGENGYLVDQPTPEKIYEKILSYLELNDRRIIHENSLKKAREYTLESATLNYYNLLKQVTKM